MLAYVFSHRPATGVGIAAYEDSLRRFHAELARTPPGGFIASATVRVEGGYSDWYLVDGSAALDTLNAAAVSGARLPPHDAAARMAADGAGKLFSLASGEPQMAAGFEIRFSKPAGMSYSDLYERLEAWTRTPGVSLWRRMMVLGPPPEFSILAPTAIELPEEMRPEVLRRAPI